MSEDHPKDYAFREFVRTECNGQPILDVEKTEQFRIDVENLTKHIDCHLHCAMLRDEEMIKLAFIDQSETAWLLWGEDESNWPASHSWATFREENMWICELRARELDPDQSKWVRYPGREVEWNV